jgi:hypothetical protein
MAIYNVEIGCVKTSQGPLNRFVDPLGRVIKFGSCNTADFCNEEDIFAWECRISVLERGRESFA